jgi:hypothetical protein
LNFIKTYNVGAGSYQIFEILVVRRDPLQFRHRVGLWELKYLVDRLVLLAHSQYLNPIILRETAGHPQENAILAIKVCELVRKVKRVNRHTRIIAKHL